MIFLFACPLRSGEEVRFLMVPAGGKVDRLVQFRHPLVLRDAKSGDRIKVYLPTKSAKQVVRV